MKYSNISEGLFISRINRFTCNAEINGQPELAHIKNTGRLIKLLKQGCRAYFQKSDNPERKTKYDLIAVEHNGSIINVDSQITNYVAEEWLNQKTFFPDLKMVKREVKYGDSRFDIYLEHGDKKAFMEIKGVTLIEDGIARFPDAPTKRGVKHLHELMKCIDDGYEAYIMFVIQLPDVKWFEAAVSVQEEFATTLKEAWQKGVHVIAYGCDMTKDSIEIARPIEVRL
ncbi:MAG: DNA/RNA nuclease SfsA [Butyrivibrio sp.]|uniref:DNA/RNA nuclease SfsA n=1 Tax=Butyrivibrio sp. TaxID=28121 RepID=UPI0025F0DB47|nr:DNA/RNA nuclease SfsA [Butyrivibrio sp.]MCR5770735.1 DNA/RNA nuclease SfsA [Butyrivibrio sp.]